MIQDSDLDSFLRSDAGSDEPAAAPKTGSAPPSAGSFTFNLKAITPEISQAFKVAADVYGVDENVLIGIAARESGFNPQAIGPVTKKGKRAVGLMMFMPDTAKEYGIDPTDPIESVMAAAAYMRQSLDRFGGDYRKSIASYNWGRDRSEFDSPDWDKSLPKETSQYLAYVEQFIGADGEPAKGDSFGTARTEDRGFVPDVQDTSEMEAASKPYFGTSSPKSRRPQESLSPTVVGPSAPEDLPTTSKVPVDPKVRAEIYAAWDAADPGKRAMMEAAPGWAGMLARERAGVFKRFDAGKTGAVEQFDPRREARSNRLVGAGENATFADRAAKEAAASGIDPGNEVKFIQGQYGTIGTNRSPIGQMQDELAATRPGAKPEGVVEVASNAIMRGIHQNAGMGSALLAAGAKSIGADGLALDLLRSYFLRQIDAKKYPAQIEDFTKIDSLSDVPVYVLEGVLENAPQLVGTIGSSVIGATLAKKFGAKAVADMAVEQAGKELARRQAIGAAVGAGATSIGMETGSIYGDVAKDTGQERPGVAASFGVVAGALDAIPAFRAATKILGQDTSSFVAKEIFKRYGTEAVKQLRSEGGTEFLQTWIEEAAKTYVDGRPLLTAENLIQAIDAGLKGGPAGAVTGASSQGISDFRNRALIAVDDAAKKAKSDALNKWQSFADAGKRAPQERNAEAKIADISKAETIDEVAAKALEVVNTPVASAASVTTAPDLAPTVDAITALENTNVSPSGDSGVVAAGAPASQADQSGPGVGAAGLTEPDTRGSGSVDTAAADSSVPASGTVPQPGGESSPAVEPAKVWYGRRGDGYLTPEDAQRGLGERQRLQGQFDWRIEPTPDGKYRLAGYAPSTATGTVQASAPAYQSVNQSPITFRQGKGGSWFVGGDPATIRDLLRANGITNFLPTKDGAQLPANTDPEVIGAIRMMAEDFKNLSIQELKNEIRQRMGMTQPPKEPKQTRPFRDFLRSVGIRSDIAGDVVGESNRMRANQILPMTFRRNGLNLDALAERALEMGFLTQQDIDNPNDNGGVNRLVEMIKAESRGVRQAPIDEQTSVDAEQAQAEKELTASLDKLGVPASSYADLSVPQMNSMLNRIERRLRDARLRKQQLDVAEESRLEREAIQMADQITLADVSALERRSEMREASLEQFMRALLFTEQEIQNELAKQANQAQSDQAPAGDAATGPQGSAEADAGNTDRASQAGPAGEVDLFGAAPNASQQEANRIRQEREDRERAQQQSAPSPDEFSLSGSDRAADVGAASGQGDLLAPTEKENATSLSMSDGRGKEAVESDQVAAPKADADLVKVMTVFGKNTYVRRADMDGDPNRLVRQFTKEGKNNGRIARGNLDPTGEQRKALATDDANNPLFNVITRKDGAAFATKESAQRELKARGLEETHEVVPASTLKDGADGFIVSKKQQAMAPSATKDAQQAAPAEKDYFSELFGTPEQQADAQAKFEADAQAKKRGLSSVRTAIADQQKRARSEYDEWADRQYKQNKTQVDLRGDGPGNQASMSIGAINESRRRNAMESLAQEIGALDKMADEASTDTGAERLAGRLADLYRQASKIASDGTGLFKTADEQFEYMLLDDLKFRGPSGKGNVTSNGLSKAVLAVIKTGTTKDAQPAPSEPMQEGKAEPSPKAKIDDFGEKLTGAREDDSGNVALYEPSPQPYTGSYETDLFGNPLPSQAPGRASGAKPRGAGLRGDVQPEPAVLGDAAQGIQGDYYVETIVSSPVSRELGASVIRTPADLAQATQYLYKSAVERFDAIVTDKDGKPLAVVGNFKGALSQTSVYPSTVVAEAFRVPGAAHIWFSHNHPSGLPTLSAADEQLGSTMARVFRGSSITPMGIMAVGKGRYSFQAELKPLGGDRSSGDIPKAQGRFNVPVYEREQQDERQAPIAINGPQAAQAIGKSFYDRSKGPGILLLDAQHGVNGWLPVNVLLSGPLRDTGGMDALYRAISRSNAGSAILVHGGELSVRVPNTSRPIDENIAGALLGIGVRVLDSIDVTTGGSVASSGLSVGREGVFFSRGSQPFYSSLRQSIEKINAKALPPGLWKDGIRGLLNKGAVKADEVEWSGLNEWLDLQSGKVTKDQVLAYLDANGVRVEEVTLGAKSNAEADKAMEKWGIVVARNPEDPGQVGFIDRDNPDDIMTAEELEEAAYPIGAVRAAMDIESGGVAIGAAGFPKYTQYTLPGGTNYREVLLTLPVEKQTAWRDKQGRIWTNDEMADEATRRLALRRGAEQIELPITDRKEPIYRSSHWDQPNVLAHIRMNDRVDAGGAKTLLIEEIQSDFAQDYRKSKDAINKAVDDDFEGIVKRMKYAGVLEVNCD